MLRAVDRNLGEVETDHAVLGRERLFDEQLEDPGGEPLVASASKCRFPALAEASRDVPGAAGDEAEQDRLEAVPVRDASPVTAEGMGRFSAFG